LNSFINYFNFEAGISTNIFWCDTWTATMSAIILIFLVLYVYSSAHDSHELHYLTNVLLPIFLGLFVLIVYFLPFVNNLFLMYVYIELVAFVLYFIFYYFRINSKAILIYFIINCLASAILLFGLSLMVYSYPTYMTYYNLFEWFDITRIGDKLDSSNQNSIIIIGLQFFIAGILIKLGLFPVYSWLIYVYNSINNYSILFFLLILVKFFYISILVLLIINFSKWCTSLLYLVGVSSFLVGAFGAILQTRIINFIGFTSLNQVGFITLSLLLIDEHVLYEFNTENFNLIDGLTYLNNDNLAFIYLYIIAYFICLNLFLVILTSIQIKSNTIESRIIYFSDLAKSENIQSVRFLLLIVYFTFTGLPPFSIFFFKLAILYKFIENGYYILFFIILCTSIISAIYYFRIIKLILINSERAKTNVYMVGHDPIVETYAVFNEFVRYNYLVFPIDFDRPYFISYTYILYELFLFIMMVCSSALLSIGGIAFFLIIF
jgi:NADH-quinone oxidoreductase subunit N